jgi:hypothetical protein
MGIMSRILRLWKADLHGVMDQIEDKPLLLKQHLREMEEDLRGKEGQLGQLRQMSRQLQREAELRGQEIGQIEADLDQALYFYIQPLPASPTTEKQKDAFEQARRSLESLLEDNFSG